MKVEIISSPKFGSKVAKCPLNVTFPFLFALVMVWGCDEVRTNTGSTDQFSNVATLSSLSTSAHGVIESFSPELYSYVFVVSSGVSSMSITAVATHPRASIRLYGPELPLEGVTIKSGEESVMMSLVLGTNIIALLVRSDDGTTKNLYSITVNQVSG
ncbi:MAG: cadherin-like beta sandwich domain-containing protein [candidate division Zixibacteria bacterium]|nr:cadherin-like beta sandwich domain-containing protein [candidate division Zixibacteria bacterium]